MKISRIIYGLLILALVFFYFKPWIIIGGQNMPGWSTILPFSFFYFIGLVTAIVVLLTGYRAVGLSLLSGIFMFGSNLLTGVFLGLMTISKNTQLGSAFAYVFFLSIVFLILGPICASGFDKTSNLVVSPGDGFWKKLIWGTIISILTALILHYFFHIG